MHWVQLAIRFRRWACGNQDRPAPLSLASVMDSMGRSDIKTTRRYTHAISNDRREAVERATQAFLRPSAANLETKSFNIN